MRTCGWRAGQSQPPRRFALYVARVRLSSQHACVHYQFKHARVHYQFKHARVHNRFEAAMIFLLLLPYFRRRGWL